MRKCCDTDDADKRRGAGFLVPTDNSSQAEIFARRTAHTARAVPATLCRRRVTAIIS